MSIKLLSIRSLFAGSFILLLTLSACGLLGPKSQIDESLEADELILLLGDLSRDFEAEDTDDLEDLLDDLLDDFTGDFEGRADIESFSYGIPHGSENVLGFTIEIKDPADWIVYDEKTEDFEDDFIEEFLELAEVTDDYESDNFDLDYGDTSAAISIEYKDINADIFTFRRDRFAYIVAHIYTSDPDTDSDEIAEILDERVLDLYSEDDPRLDENEDLEITITTDLASFFRGTIVLFQDDFSQTSTGWDRSETDDAVTDYSDGVYRIQLNTDDYIAWAGPYVDLTDVIIEVETFKASGGDDNGFGIICRHENVENFYFLEISSDGYAWIGKQYLAEFELLDSTESSLINLGNAANNLRAECVGNRLALYINGTLELEVFDSDHSHGDVGLIAETYYSTSTEILFDNFVVTQP